MKPEQINHLLDDFPSPPEDTLDVYVEMNEEDLHLVDDIIKGYDGLANVRREYRVYKGQKQFRILVSPDYLERLQAVLRELRAYVYIGEITVEGISHGC